MQIVFNFGVWHLLATMNYIYSYFTVRLIFLLVNHLVTKCETRRQFEEIIQNAQINFQAMFPNEVNPPKDDVAVIEAERKFENETVPDVNEAVQEIIENALKDFQEKNTNELNPLKDHLSLREDKPKFTASILELIKIALKYLTKKLAPLIDLLMNGILGKVIKYIQTLIPIEMRDKKPWNCTVTAHLKIVKIISGSFSLSLQCDKIVEESATDIAPVENVNYFHILQQ